MAATRLRLVAEYRNGDGNYLRKEFDPEKWVPCKGEHDLSAFIAAFLVLVDHTEGRSMELRKLLAEHKPPNHD